MITAGLGVGLGVRVEVAAGDGVAVGVRVAVGVWVGVGDGVARTVDRDPCRVARRPVREQVAHRHGRHECVT